MWGFWGVIAGNHGPVQILNPDRLVQCRRYWFWREVWRRRIDHLQDKTDCEVEGQTADTLFVLSYTGVETTPTTVTHDCEWAWRPRLALRVRLSALVDPTPTALKSLKCLVLGLSFETSMETPNHRRRGDADTAASGPFLCFHELWFSRHSP